VKWKGVPTASEFNNTGDHRCSDMSKGAVDAVGEAIKARSTIVNVFQNLLHLRHAGRD
jgi:hypothetical protein